MKVRKIKYLSELRNYSDPWIAKLLIAASQNLGGDHGNDWTDKATLDKAYQNLLDNVTATMDDEGGGEDGVVAEVNFVRDCVK